MIDKFVNSKFHNKLYATKQFDGEVPIDTQVVDYFPLE